MSDKTFVDGDFEYTVKDRQAKLTGYDGSETLLTIPKMLGSYSVNAVNLGFVAIDFETGMYARESACAIGLVKYIDGKKKDTFYSLIKPPKLYIRPEFTDIHGIRVEDVADAPTFKDIWKDVLAFTGKLPLVAHNASFDMPVLRAVLAWYSLPCPSLDFFCSLKIARKVWSSLPSHALTSLGDYFGIEYVAHNALEDADTCGKIVCLAMEKTGSLSVKELLEKTGTSFQKI